MNGKFGSVGGALIRHRLVALVVATVCACASAQAFAQGD